MDDLSKVLTELHEEGCVSLLWTIMYLYHIAENKTVQPGVSEVKAELSQIIVAISHRIQIVHVAQGTKKEYSSEHMEDHLFKSYFSLLSCHTKVGSYHTFRF